MPTVNIYRVTLASSTRGNVSWLECEGFTGPSIFLNETLNSVVIEAQPGTITAPAGATIENLGAGNSNCMGGSETPTTTTTTSTTTTNAPTTTTLAPSSFSLGYDASSALNACTDFLSSPSTYYSYGGVALTESTKIFTNTGLTAIAPNGYYSSGSFY